MSWFEVDVVSRQHVGKLTTRVLSLRSRFKAYLNPNSTAPHFFSFLLIFVSIKWVLAEHALHCVAEFCRDYQKHTSCGRYPEGFMQTMRERIQTVLYARVSFFVFSVVMEGGMNGLCGAVCENKTFFIHSIISCDRIFFC